MGLGEYQGSRADGRDKNSAGGKREAVSGHLPCARHKKAGKGAEGKEDLGRRNPGPR